MATAVKPKKRVVVKGIDHGLSGYTNFGCRCETCTRANTECGSTWRERMFAGNPLCLIPKCDRGASRAYSNGLCYRHAKKLIRLRLTNPAKARRIERALGIPHRKPRD